MNRLTQQNSTYYEKAIKQLQEYENTGLTPAQIEQLQKENAELKARLEKSIELLSLAATDQDIGDLCEKCVADCVSAGFNEDEPTFQCGCFLWRYQSNLDELLGGGKESE